MLRRFANPRLNVAALRSASRSFAVVQPDRFATPTPQCLRDINSDTLDDAAMERILSKANFETLMNARETGAQIPKKVKNEIANSVREWAQSRGAVGYNLWFHPMRGPRTGSKMETFLQMDFSDNNNLAIGFSGTEMFMTETDGSSFPNGGLRVTHGAAAFMAWDMSSPPFVYEKNLYLPSSFVAWSGDALDYKTPLLRSEHAVDTQATRVVKLLGDNEATGVVSNLGWEQEFFIIDRAHYDARPDLVNTGRTLFGAAPTKGQDQSEEYFGKMPVRVAEYMAAIRDKFWKVGISADCFHNEVAPAQHEFAPIFKLTGAACDSNVLAMEIMRDTAVEFDLAVLQHEKPFAGINGSGKHNNWGLNIKDTGSNLFVPGKTEHEQARFVTFVTALTAAVKRHGDLFRIAVSTSGNDFRLGAQEAPPAIFTLYVGAGLEAHLRAVAAGGPLVGYSGASKEIPVGKTVNHVSANAEDRNRTAPFPWCGNRFEFRAVGSNQHCALPMAILNTTMANVLRDMADRAEANGKGIEAVVRETLQEVQGALFSGNGYDSDLIESVRDEHNLFHLKTSPEAYAELTSPKNIACFSGEQVLSEHELVARQNILNDAFTTEVTIEANVALRMLRQSIIPAVLADIQTERGSGFKSAGLTAKEQAAQKLLEASDALQEAVDNAPDGTEAEGAVYANDVIRPAMNLAREHADFLETRIQNYPFPSYDILLRSHHNHF